MGTTVYGDPDALDRLAARTRARAAEIRQRTADHVRRGEATRWVSASASAYRAKVEQDRRRADHAADELERAAAALTAHAQEVREMIARIAEAERQVVAWFDRQVRVVVGPLKRTALDLPWSGWPYQPGNLPATGDRGWLDVGRFMRDQGVF